MFCLNKIYNTQFLNNLKPIIEVNHVWKEYQKGIDRRYKSLRDTLVGMSNRLFGTEKEKFWALEDIDFKVEAGESIGIIGRNGAGKSTLLKILSRITPPTKGEIILRGRVASLLEVGTGFHPELTGRENVFFNGSILGMKHAEIKRKFDEIVDFSGVESFIDTPLKHYSSGMQMRLAFSVAAHLDSEILLIDEVLAVGDSEFQKKCIGKMDDVSKGDGKSILFVSHNLTALSNLCPKSVLLSNGKILKFEKTTNVINHYLNQDDLMNHFKIWEKNAQTNKIITLNSIRLVSDNLESKATFSQEEVIGLEIKYTIIEAGHIIRCGFNLFNSEDLNIFDSHNFSTDYYDKAHPSGDFKLYSWIPSNLLKNGTYFVGVGFFNHQIGVTYLREKKVISFNITNNKEMINGQYLKDDLPGIIHPTIVWELKSN